MAELSAIKNIFHADTLRFQLSQSGLDPESADYDGSYVQDILEGVRTGQGTDFAVILAIDAQQDGMPELACMPSDSTNRAWKSIAPSFADDPGVMLELFNEPCKWRDADSQKEWARSMQMLIDTVRGVGSTNILLLDGLRWARSTNGLFPLVQDKMRERLALAAHPYLAKNFITEEQWRNEFGASAAQYPLIASEWNAVTQGSHCAGGNTPALALAMIRYLKSLHVGLIGWAIDWNEPMLVKDHTSYEPTDYAAFRACDDGSNSGAGRLLADYPNE